MRLSVHCLIQVQCSQNAILYVELSTAWLTPYGVFDLSLFIVLKRSVEKLSPSSCKRLTKLYSTLAQRRRRWVNVESTLGQPLVSAGPFSFFLFFQTREVEWEMINKFATLEYVLIQILQNMYFFPHVKLTMGKLWVPSQLCVGKKLNLWLKGWLFQHLLWHKARHADLI